MKQQGIDGSAPGHADERHHDHIRPDAGHGMPAGDAQHGGHDGHGGHGDHAAVFRDRFWLSLTLTVPVVAGSHMIADWFGYTVPSWATWVAPVLGTVVYLYGGWPFLTGAVSEVRDRRPGMMTLVALAITVAFVASGATSLGLGGLMLDFWWELALLVVIMLLGHWLEMRALGQASGALAALADLLPDTAERIDGSGVVREVPLAELGVGDVVLVRSGARVPADGVVVDGAAEVDESMVTGESRPVPRGSGDRVVAGTVATDSALRVRVDAVGEDTALAGIRRLVADAQASRSRAQALADRAAAFLFWFAAAAGAMTFVVWAALGDLSAAVERTVTVLVIACPHALGLAIPLVIAISTALSARAGILVKDRIALERMRTVDTVLFDKTGTLTRGRPAVTAVAAVDGVTDTELYGLAGAAESDSEHPLARAVVAAAGAVTELPAASGFRSMTGRGVEAEVAGHRVAVGGPALLRELGATPTPALAAQTREWAARGATVLHVLRDGAVVGALALEDEIRPESRETVAGLHAAGVRAVMVTGDAREVAEAVAAELGLDEVFAEVLPADKDAAVAQLQARGQRVAMVGDGVNDAPALARADVGIAIGAGTDVAIESAGVVLASDDPRGVLATRRLSEASYRKMWQNLAWATGYNLLSVPLAAGVLAGIGFVLPPAAGAVAMSLSTIVVALNAQLLRRLDLRPGGSGGASSGGASSGGASSGGASSGGASSGGASSGGASSGGPSSGELASAGSIGDGPARRERGTAFRVTVYGAALVLVAGAAYATGTAVGPLRGETPAAPVATGGYALTPVSPAPPAGVAAPFAFRVTGPDGAAVTRFDVEHDKRMHLIVVRDDTTGFQHVHPEMAADGTWTVPLTLAAPGTYRAFADFTPTGGEGLTLPADVVVAGRAEPVVHEPSRVAHVDGYTVELTGDLVPGQGAPVTLTVSRDGRPVTDLEPYLAAYGHLVALREGDLAYSHVHPEGDPGDGRTPAGPEIRFVAEVPSAGSYRLFLDFRHGGVVRTAEFTVPTSTQATPPPGHTDDHGH